MHNLLDLVLRCSLVHLAAHLALNVAFLDGWAQPADNPGHAAPDGLHRALAASCAVVLGCLVH